MIAPSEKEGEVSSPAVAVTDVPSEKDGATPLKDNTSKRAASVAEADGTPSVLGDKLAAAPSEKTKKTPKRMKADDDELDTALLGEPPRKKSRPSTTITTETKEAVEGDAPLAAVAMNVPSAKKKNATVAWSRKTVLSSTKEMDVAATVVDPLVAVAMQVVDEEDKKNLVLAAPSSPKEMDDTTTVVDPLVTVAKKVVPEEDKKNGVVVAAPSPPKQPAVATVVDPLADVAMKVVADEGKKNEVATAPSSAKQTDVATVVDPLVTAATKEIAADKKKEAVAAVVEEAPLGAAETKARLKKKETPSSSATSKTDVAPAVVTSESSESKEGETPSMPRKRSCTHSSKEPDVVVIVGDTVFEEYSQILCSTFEYFDAAYKNDWKEAASGRFEFPGRDPKEWELVTSLMAPLATVKIDENNIHTALLWFDELCCSRGLAACDDFLADVINKMIPNPMSYSGEKLTRIIDELAPTSLRFNLAASKSACFRRLHDSAWQVPREWTKERLKGLLSLMREYPECCNALANMVYYFIPESISDEQKRWLFEKELLHEIVHLYMPVKLEEELRAGRQRQNQNQNQNQPVRP